MVCRTHGNGLPFIRGGIVSHVPLERGAQAAFFGRGAYGLICALDARNLDSRASERNRALMSAPIVSLLSAKKPDDCAITLVTDVITRGGLITAG